jgi:Ca-activated chloride channel family protein
MFRFAHPLWLLLLPLFPLLAFMWSKWREPSSIQYSDLGLVRGLPRTARQKLRWVPGAFRVIVLTLLLFAIARPQLGSVSNIVRGRGVDIVMALDISGSMAALDFEPQNRLTAAKQVIEEFVERRRFDRIALVVFAREAFSQGPLTVDHAVLQRLLAEVDLATELGLDDGTAIGLGIAQAAAMLQNSDAKSRIIILLTDGVNNAGQVGPLTAAQAAAALGIRTYTVGVARPGQVPVPVESGIQGPTTRLEESKIDEDTLRRIAEETGGRFFRADDTAGLRQIYGLIDNLEKSDIEVQVFTRYQELAGWFLAAALCLVVVEMLLRQTVFRTLP